MRRRRPDILKAGARIMVISNEHPEALERMRPDPALEGQVRTAARMLRGTKRMKVTSAAGTDLDVNMEGAQTVGIWGWTEKPGTLAHWPGGIVVSFPKANSVNGTLMIDRGDINLTFKRYMAEPIRLDFKDDYITDIVGEGTDAEMFRKYLAAWGDREAYAVVACRLRHEPCGALRGFVDVWPARHQRHRDPRGCRATSCSPPAPTNLPAATPRAISICR